MKQMALFAALVGLGFVLAPAIASAYWPPRFSAIYQGQCMRPNHQPALVVLVLSPSNSEFNRKPLINPDLNGGTVSFDTDGLFQGEQIRRHVVGVLQPDFSTILIKITQPDAKWADCVIKALEANP